MQVYTDINKCKILHQLLFIDCYRLIVIGCKYVLLANAYAHERQWSESETVDKNDVNTM